MNRIEWIDIAKFIGIFLVILAHTPLYGPLSNFIYTFHMPLFFFISGYLFSRDRYVSYYSFFSKRIRQLFVPYIAISLLTYLFWFFIGSKFGADAYLEIEWYKPLLATLIGYGKNMVHDIPIWFILCLFCVENIYFLIFKQYKVFMLCIFLLIAYMDYQLSYSFSFCINVSLAAILFYSLGNILRKYEHYILNLSTTKTILIGLLLLIITLIITEFNGKINMYVREYGNFGYFIVGGLSGTLFILIFSRLLSNILHNRFITYIATNTLIVCGFHLITFSLIKGLMLYAFHIPIVLLEGGISTNIIFSIISLLMCLPFIYVIDKYFPFIAGRKFISP